MKLMSSKDIKDRYGHFSDTARRETVVHTSHGRPTLVTISVDRARSIPELNREISAGSAIDKTDLLARVHSFAGIGIELVGCQSAKDLDLRSSQFRGNDE
ncbi:MAG: hypothetical protein WCC66_03520 [Rhizobiaceae bacterium]